MAKMESESKRLESFSGWPASSPVKPDELAKAGFYYTRDNDEVRCFSCNLHLNNWEKGDDARQEHQEKSPGCSFIKAGWQYIPDQVDIQCKSSLEKDVDIFSPATYSSSDVKCMNCKKVPREVLSKCDHYAVCKSCATKIKTCPVKGCKY